LGIISLQAPALGGKPYESFLILTDIYHGNACPPDHGKPFIFTVIYFNAAHGAYPHGRTAVFENRVCTHVFKATVAVAAVYPEPARKGIIDIYPAGISTNPQVITIKTESMNIVE